MSSVKSLILLIGRCDWMARLLRSSLLYKLGNWFLGRFPTVTKLNDGLSYSCRSSNLVFLAQSFFTDQEYDPKDLPAGLRTVCDLGSNAGFFTLWIAHKTGSRKISGLAIDANPAMTAETKRHLATNGLDGVRALNAFVGAGTDGSGADFYIDPNCINSSSDSSLNRKKIEVPSVCVENQWVKSVGDVRCDLLKVDIEGEELNFFRNEKQFLRRVGTIIVERHNYKVARQAMVEELAAQGFKLVNSYHETAEAEIDVFKLG